MPNNLPPDWDEFWQKKEAAATSTAPAASPSSSPTSSTLEPSTGLPPDWDNFWANKAGAKPGEKTSPLMFVEDFDYQVGRQERQARQQANEAVEVERSLPGEVGASVVRGALGLAKLPVQVAKIVGSDVLGSDTVKRATVPLIESLEETAASPEWKPSKEAGGAPIDLERMVSNPGEVLGQITSQISNPRFWASQLPEGAMSMIPAIVGAWAPRAVAYAGKLGTALEAAKVAGDTAKIAEIGAKINRLGTIGMYGMSMAMEAAQGEEKVREYEEKHPEKSIPWGNRVLAILGTGVVAGSLEAMSLERIFSGKAGMTMVRKILDSVATEGLTEGAQSIVENAFAKYNFDPDQKLLEGVVESVLVGAALGGIAGTYEGYHLKVHNLAQKAQAEWEAAKAQQPDILAAWEGAHRGVAYAGMPAVQEVAPPEPVLAPAMERPGPQPVAHSPAELQQAIFGGELGQVVERHDNQADAVRALVPLVGTFERAQQFYDLYQQGDATTALREFPEFSTRATPTQREVVAFQLPSPFTGKPRPATPMVSNGMEAVERASAKPEVADLPSAGTVTGPSATASPATPASPIGVTGAEAEMAATHKSASAPAAATPTTDVVPPSSEAAVAAGPTNVSSGSVNTPQEASNAFSGANLPSALTGRTPRTGPTIETAMRQPLSPGTAPRKQSAGPSPAASVEAKVSSEWHDLDAGTIQELRDHGNRNIDEAAYDELLPYDLQDKVNAAISRREAPRLEKFQADRGKIVQALAQEVGAVNKETGENAWYGSNENHSTALKWLEHFDSAYNYNGHDVAQAIDSASNLIETVKGQEIAGRLKTTAQRTLGIVLKPLPSAITGKKAGPVAQAKPVARHPGLPAGIVPKKTEAKTTPELKEGDRVAWTNAKGEELTGTIDGHPRNGKADIMVDQVATIQGRVPIGRLEMGVKVENLRRIGEPLAKSKETPNIEAKEAPSKGDQDHDNANVPQGPREDDQGSVEGQGSETVPGTGGKRKAGRVRGTAGLGNDGGVQPGLQPSDSASSEGGRGKGRRDEDQGGHQHGPEQTHGGSPVNLAGVQRPDYRIQPGEIKRSGGWKATAARNLDIIQLVKTLEQDGRQATLEEQALLVQYTGMGASEIANNLFPGFNHSTGTIRPEWAKDQHWEALANRVQQLLTPEEIKAAARSTQYAHYTSEKVIRSIYKAVEKFGFPGGKVLEPGMGTGLFAGLMPEGIKNASTYTGIEMDNITAAIAKQLFPGQNIIHGDYTKQAFPDNFFDMAIGNPPFASTVIRSDPAYAKQRFKLHDYFFAKTIDKVRPGGLLVFITSRYTMDKQGDRARRYLAERADLVGAIRLPQTAFKENAGTEVVTDVLFLRKRAEGEAPGGYPWMDLQEVKTPQGNTQVNEYFAEHPEMVLGSHTLQGTMYKAGEYTVLPKTGDIEEQFAAAVEKLPEKIYSITQRPAEDQRYLAMERDFNPKNKKEGGVYLADDGTLMSVEQGVGVPLLTMRTQKGGTRNLTLKELTWLKDYVALRDAVKQAQYDQLNDGAWKDSLKVLNQVYDRFVKKHGKINDFTWFEKTKTDDYGNEATTVYQKFKNNALLRLDVESPIVQALERITEDGDIFKGKILQGRVIQKPTPIQPQTIHEALAVTLDEIGRLDLKAIAEKLSITRDEAVDSLGDLIYKAPGQDWQLADEYLSGNVVKKLEEAQAAAQVDKRYERNIKALEKVQPQPLSAQDVTVQLGAGWIPEEVVRDFAQEVIGIQTAVSYRRNLAIWVVPGSATRYQRGATTEWGSIDRSPYEILSSVLNNQTIKITKTVMEDGVRKTYIDQDATAQANEIAKKMKAAFLSWVWTDATRAGKLLDKYNREINNLAPRYFDGSHLTLPGLSVNFPLHDHQKRAIWRAVQTGNTYFAHAVGSGKTLEMICSGMEMKRLGLVSKPMYAVPNHMLAQFASEFLQAYPLANIMVADEESFHTSNRRRFMAQAALNKPDAIIITHSAMGLLGMKPENVTSVRDQFIRDLEDQIELLKDEDRQGNRFLIKKVEKRIEQLEQKFDNLINRNTDRSLSFEEMGVDFLFVDEAHEFRKLDFITNRQVKGIDSNGSQKAMGLYLKTLWLNSQNPGRSHIFASGTPITNTLAELYTLQKFFDLGGMEAEGLSYFDAWANMYGELASSTEMNAAGNYEQVERFARFSNIPELMKRVRKFMDVLTFSQLSGRVSLPEVKGGKPDLIITKLLSSLKAYQTEVLTPRIEISKKTPPKENHDPIINIITDGRLASIDLRFVTAAGNDPDSKLNRMIDEIIKAHHATKDEVYLNAEGKPDPLKGATQIVFYNHGFGAGVISKRGFESRKFMMERLQKGGVNLNEVAWIDDYKTAASKEALFKKMRQGQMRILIGSAKKMGTGVNVQTRLKNMHYLDPPWYPADLEQPQGRILRQGNQNKNISITWYATKGSYDSTMWQMVARKAKFIEQAFIGDDSVRAIDDISESSQYQMVSAVTTGDQRYINLAGAQGEVERLTRLRSAHATEQQRLRWDKGAALRDQKFYRERIENLEKAQKAVDGYIRDIQGKVDGKQFDSRAEFGEALKRAYNKTVLAEINNADKTSKVIATLNGFDLVAETRPKSWGDPAIFGELWFRVTDKVQYQLESDPQLEEETSGQGLTTRIVNNLNGIGENIRQVKRDLSEAEANLQAINRRLGAPFEHEQVLLEKIAEVARIQQELHSEGQSTPSQGVGAAIAEGLAAEKQVTQRTGPTPATAMRRPSLPAGIVPKQAGAKYQLSTRPGEGGSVTLQAVRERFGGVEVQEIDGGRGYGIDLPNGKTMVILTGEDLAANREEILKTYGREPKEEEWVAGEWRQMSVGGVIALAKGAGTRTLDHETFHAACDLVLRQKELDAILKKHGDWESAAAAYETWKPAEPNSLFQKVLNFFRRLAGLLQPTANGVFAQIKSGEVWVRTEAGPGTGETGLFEGGGEGLPRALGGKRLKTISPTRDAAVVRQGDTWRLQPGEAGKLSAVSVREINNLGFNTEQSPVVLTEENFPHLNDKVGPQVAPEDLSYLKLTIEEPSEILPNLAIKEKDYRANSVLMVRRNGKDFVSIVEITPGEKENILWNFWKMDRKSAENYLAKFRQEKARLLNLEERPTVSSYSSQLEAGQPEGLPGSQVEQPSNKNISLPEEKGKPRYALRSADSEAVLTQYHHDLMAQDPGSKSLWRRFWDKDPSLKTSWTEMRQRAYDQVVDRFAPGERAQEKLARLGLALPAGERFTSAIGFWRGQEGWNHEAVLGSGIYADPVETLGSGESFFTGATPTRAGDSLFKRVDPIRDLAKARNLDRKEVFRDLRLLMVANRDLELSGEVGIRERGSIEGTKPEQSQAALQALEAKYGDDLGTLQQIGGKWNADGTFSPGLIQEWADQAILQRLVQGGIISRDLYNQIKAKNQAYIPFMRLMDELDAYIKSTGGGKVIKEIKGSGRAIVDPFQMLIELSAKANYAYAKNRMLRSLYQMGQASPEMGIKDLKPKVVPGIPKPATTPFFGLPTQTKTAAFSPLPPEKGAIPFYQDGKRSWLKLPPDLYGMTQNLMPEDLGLLMWVLKWPADVLRTGAVTTPEFGLVKNPMRDLIQAWLFNRAGFSPQKWFRDLYLTLSKDPATVKMKAEMAAGGGFMATLAQSTVDEKITAADVEGKKKNLVYVVHPVEGLRKLSAYLENLTRFSLYRQAREKGLAHAEAIHEARRTTLDFRRLGAHPVARYLNMIIPFWNASIQGIDKLVTELTGPNKAAVWRRLGVLSAVSIGLALLFHDDDRLKELEDWEKNYFWHIPLGKTGPIIRLPKPFEAGILFGSVPERLVEIAKGDNTTGLQTALKAAVDALTPEMIPAILRPMVELKSNYNFFLGRPIEDAGLKNLPVELRSKPWTTPLAKAISAHGGDLIGLSPVKVEHFVRSFSGGLGANYYFPLADFFLRKAGMIEDLPNPQQDAIERAFGIRALFTKPPVGYRAKSVGDFFENVQGVIQADQGWKLLWNTGSMDKLDAFLKANPEAMFAWVAREQMAELGKIKKERNAIHLSKTMTPTEKKTKLDALDEKIVNLARTGNAMMDPDVAQALKMPSRFKTEAGTRKAMDLDGYYKMVVESVGDAYDTLQKDLPRILRMEDDQRQRLLIKTIRQAREEYQPTLKKPEDVTKSYRFSNLLDKPTRKERASWQQLMGVRTVPSGAASDFRLKEAN